MPPRPELLQLERNEDVASVRGRLLSLAQQRVLLVWPIRGSALTRRLDLVLVQREAQRLGVQLALLTQDPDVIRHASELNLSTFATVGASERGRWKRGRARLLLPGRSQDSVASDTSARDSAVARAQTARRRPAPVLRLTGAFILLLFVLALGAGAVLLILPTATITLLPARSLVETEALITANPDATNIDLEGAVIPAIRLSITVEESASLPPGGSQQLSSTPASGHVVFVNLGDTPVEIPAGTLVGTSGAEPVWFRTLTRGSLEATTGHQVELAIEATADHAGPGGNVDSGFINIMRGELAQNVSVSNPRPTSGGGSRSVGIVLPEDHESLLATVRQQLKSQAYISLLSRLQEGQHLILESMSIVTERSDWTRFSAAAGEATGLLSLDMKAIVEAIAIEESLAQQVVLDRLNDEVSQGSRLLRQTVNHERGQVVSDYADGLLRFWRSAHALAEAVVDADGLRERLVGMTSAEARARIHQELELQPGTTPRIDIAPDWPGRMPFLPFRIQVQFAEQA